MVGGLAKVGKMMDTVPAKLEAKTFLMMIWLLATEKVAEATIVPLREHLVTEAEAASLAVTEAG